MQISFFLLSRRGKRAKSPVIDAFSRNFQRIEGLVIWHSNTTSLCSSTSANWFVDKLATIYDIRHDRLVLRFGRIILMPGITACQRHIAL